MALVLSLKDNEIVYIDNNPYMVCDICEDYFHLENLLTSDVYIVETTKMIEVYPEVKVSAGHFNKYNSVKLVVEAPKTILITRREKRNEDNRGNKK